MVQPTALRHVNGRYTIQCANCGTELGDDRAVANMGRGLKFFCRMSVGDGPEDSCYLNWQRRRARRRQ